VTSAGARLFAELSRERNSGRIVPSGTTFARKERDALRMDAGLSPSPSTKDFAMTALTKTIADHSDAECRALSDNELDLVAGGMTNAQTPEFQAFMKGVWQGYLRECAFGSSTHCPGF
jgi:hypothetical protein